MIGKDGDSRRKMDNGENTDSWPKRARAMNEAGKKLKDRFGTNPISGNAISKVVSEMTGLKESGLQPSDYCYNSKNKDPQSNRWNVFLKVGLGLYEYVGPFFDHKGEVDHSLRPVEQGRSRTKREPEPCLPTPEISLKSEEIDASPGDVTDHDILLKKLLAGPAIPFEKRFESHVPNELGLYGIRSKNGKFLHVGVSHKAGLRKRLFAQHLNGGGKRAASDLVQKVQDRGLASNRRDAKLWIQQNCLIYCLAESDKSVRTWAEHYLLARLRPIWGA